MPPAKASVRDERLDLLKKWSDSSIDDRILSNIWSDSGFFNAQCLSSTGKLCLRLRHESVAGGSVIVQPNLPTNINYPC